MSVSGSVSMKPSGVFYGAIAGKTGVTLQPNGVLALIGVPQAGLNFPGGGGSGGVGGLQLRTYSVQ